MWMKNNIKLKTDPSTDYIVQTTLKRKQTDQILPNKASCTQDESQLVTTKTLSNHRNILAITYDNQVYSNLSRHALAPTLHRYDTLHVVCPTLEISMKQ